MNRVIIITGQTATGKTTLALKLAQIYNGELINCDSRQVYKYLDIITGKDKHLLDTAKVRLFDLIEPNQYFSSYDFVKLAVLVIKKILKSGKTPIIVGGTYLYLKHLLYGFETENIPPDWQLRKSLEDKSVKQLQLILSNISTQLIRKLNQSELNNPQRLIRKIEILKFRAKKQDLQHRELIILLQQSIHSTKIILSERLGLTKLRLEFIGMQFKEKNDLRSAIEKRVVDRLKQGAIQEVKDLLNKGFKETDPGLKTIGYQQIISYLNRKYNLNTAFEQWISKEIQYAKRQFTFMKKDKNIVWQKI